MTIVGMLRKDREAFAKVYHAIDMQCDILAPASIDFVDYEDGSARAESELEKGILDIESNFLDAIAKSDFVWLFAPAGYVGTSASFELGFARSLGIPVFTDVLPEDAMLREMVTMVKSVKHVPDFSVVPPISLPGLQSYYRRVAEIRGWSEESAQDTLLLITEEIGELARSIRKAKNLKRSGGYDADSVSNEIADVQLYLVHLANILGLDLASAVADKEVINHARHMSNSRSKAS